MIRTPRTPGIDIALSSPFFTSDFLLMRFPTDVAAASASAVDFDLMQTASAIPKLKECPTVPDDVQIPSGVSFASTLKAILPDSGESPAKIPINTLPSTFRNRSPPFSTITLELSLRMSLPTCSAIAPATDAMGPTPALAAALSISLTMSGASVSPDTGTREVLNSG